MPMTTQQKRVRCMITPCLAYKRLVIYPLLYLPKVLKQTWQQKCNTTIWKTKGTKINVKKQHKNTPEALWTPWGGQCVGGGGRCRPLWCPHIWDIQETVKSPHQMHMLLCVCVLIHACMLWWWGHSSALQQAAVSAYCSIYKKKQNTQRTHVTDHWGQQHKLKNVASICKNKTAARCQSFINLRPNRCFSYIHWLVVFGSHISFTEEEHQIRNAG